MCIWERIKTAWIPGYLANLDRSPPLGVRWRGDVTVLSFYTHSPVVTVPLGALAQAPILIDLNSPTDRPPVVGLFGVIMSEGCPKVEVELNPELIEMVHGVAASLDTGLVTYQEVGDGGKPSGSVWPVTCA